MEGGDLIELVSKGQDPRSFIHPRSSRLRERRQQSVSQGPQAQLPPELARLSAVLVSVSVQLSLLLKSTPLGGLDAYRGRNS